MKVTWTGTASGMPAAGRRHSSTVVRCGGETLLVDAGEGVAAALTEAGIDTERLDAVAITHTHADHVSGLPMLLQAMHLSGRTAPLTLLVPPGREDWFRDWLYGMYMLPGKWSFPVSLLPLREGPAAGGQLRLRPFENSHLHRVRPLAAQHGIPAQSYSLLVEGGGHVLLLSGDIAGIEDIADAAAAADVLAVDTTHVTVSEIAELAGRHPELLILCTHIPPELEDELPRLTREFREAFTDRLRFAHDGLTLDLENTTTWK